MCHFHDVPPVQIEEFSRKSPPDVAFDSVNKSLKIIEGDLSPFDSQPVTSSGRNWACSTADPVGSIWSRRWRRVRSALCTWASSSQNGRSRFVRRGTEATRRAILAKVKADVACDFDFGTSRFHVCLPLRTNIG